MRTLIISLTIISMAILFQGCSKEKDINFDDPRDNYPAVVKIEYIMSSSDENIKANIDYTNSTGGESKISDKQLPLSIIVEKKVEFAEIISLSGYSLHTNNITLEIKINNKLVDTKTYEGSKYVSGSLFYQFK